MTTTYQRETFDEAYEDAIPLLLNHLAEISDNEGIPLDVNIKAYLQSEKAGLLRVYTVRDEGRLIGYAAMFVHVGLHNQNNIQATQDVFYVSPLCRGKMVGIRLLKFIEDQLKAEKVQIIYHAAKEYHPALKKLLIHCGYVVTETIYQRRPT